MEKETDEKPTEQIEQIETPKNNWLYTTDNFGKLEKNIVFESKTNLSGIRETEMDSFKIIPVKQNKNLKKKK